MKPKLDREGQRQYRYAHSIIETLSGSLSKFRQAGNYLQIKSKVDSLIKEIENYKKELSNGNQNK